VTTKPRLIDVDAASFDRLPCCGIKSPTHPGRERKRCWLQANAKFGLRAKMLLAPDGEPAGYIEYLPGEFAWRGVEARGFLFIHCVWIFRKQHQRKGWGRVMIEACLNDARKAGMHGAAVMVRDGAWLADRRLFLANGFAPSIRRHRTTSYSFVSSMTTRRTRPLRKVGTRDSLSTAGA